MRQILALACACALLLVSVSAECHDGSCFTSEIISGVTAHSRQLQQGWGGAMTCERLTSWQQLLCAVAAAPSCTRCTAQELATHHIIQTPEALPSTFYYVHGIVDGGLCMPASSAVSLRRPAGAVFPDQAIQACIAAAAVGIQELCACFCCAGGSQPITVAYAGNAKPDISSLASDLESTLTNVPVSGWDPS
jgi:hypothetical protein